MSILVGAQRRPSLPGPWLLLTWMGEDAGMTDKVGPLSRPQRTDADNFFHSGTLVKLQDYFCFVVTELSLWLPFPISASST